MNVELDVQRAVEALPTDEQFASWVTQTLLEPSVDRTQLSGDNVELTIRIVDEKESAELNEQYRHKNGATNVLSFPFEAPAEVKLNLLGDLIICSKVVQQQANEQKKDELAHWAHMVVHGTLHLLGYDHMNDADAKIMEAKEITILSQLGYPDPYQEID